MRDRIIRNDLRSSFPIVRSNGKTGQIKFRIIRSIHGLYVRCIKRNGKKRTLRNIHYVFSANGFCIGKCTRRVLFDRNRIVFDLNRRTVPRPGCGLADKSGKRIGKLDRRAASALRQKRSAGRYILICCICCSPIGMVVAPEEQNIFVLRCGIDCRKPCYSTGIVVSSVMHRNMTHDDDRTMII